MGPQQAKAKEGQAAIKSLETSLETYFNSKISVRELHDGTKVESAKFLESLYLNSNIENSIVNLFPQPLDSLKFSFDGLYTELVEAYKNKFGRNIAWLDHTDINVEKAISLVTNDSSEESKDSSLNLEEQSKPPTANITLSQNDNQTMKVMWNKNHFRSFFLNLFNLLFVLRCIISTTISSLIQHYQSLYQLWLKLYAVIRKIL